MTRTPVAKFALAALATAAAVLTVSLPSANAGWGPNGMYGNAPQAQPAPRPQPSQRPPRPQQPPQWGGYGGNQGQQTGGWNNGGQSGSYGSTLPRRCRFVRCDQYGRPVVGGNGPYGGGTYGGSVYPGGNYGGGSYGGGSYGSYTGPANGNPGPFRPREPWNNGGGYGGGGSSWQGYGGR